MRDQIYYSCFRKVEQQMEKYSYLTEIHFQLFRNSEQCFIGNYVLHQKIGIKRKMYVVQPIPIDACFGTFNSLD